MTAKTGHVGVVEGIHEVVGNFHVGEEVRIVVAVEEASVDCIVAGGFLVGIEDAEAVAAGEGDMGVLDATEIGAGFEWEIHVELAVHVDHCLVSFLEEAAVVLRFEGVLLKFAVRVVAIDSLVVAEAEEYSEHCLLVYLLVLAVPEKLGIEAGELEGQVLEMALPEPILAKV